MFYEKLSNEEIDAIAQRIRSYGAASDYDCDADFYSGGLNMPHILRVWDEQKSHYLGKLFGAKLIYIEVFDRIDKPTMTGRLVYPIVDKFIVQWEEMRKVYPKAINLGSIF